MELYRTLVADEGDELLTSPVRARTSSMHAYKAFLRGERAFRRADFGTALAEYGRATAADSSFALAWFRQGLVRRWEDPAVGPPIESFDNVMIASDDLLRGRSRDVARERRAGVGDAGERAEPGGGRRAAPRGLPGVVSPRRRGVLGRRAAAADARQCGVDDRPRDPRRPGLRPHASDPHPDRAPARGGSSGPGGDDRFDGRGRCGSSDGGSAAGPGRARVRRGRSRRSRKPSDACALVDDGGAGGSASA